jgi:phage protein U
MALGAYRFSVATAGYQDTKRSTTWRWATLDTIGAPPEHQFIGPGEDRMRLSGEIFPHYRGGLGQIDAIRMQAGRGVPFPLIEGGGWYLGLWIIEAVEEGQKYFLPDGTPRKIDFGIELKQY